MLDVASWPRGAGGGAFSPPVGERVVQVQFMLPPPVGVCALPGCGRALVVGYAVCLWAQGPGCCSLVHAREAAEAGLRR